MVVGVLVKQNDYISVNLTCYIKNRMSEWKTGGSRTLDLEHCNMMQKIAAHQKRINDTNENLKSLRDELRDIDSKPVDDMSDIDFERRRDLLCKCHDLEVVLSQCNDNADETGYYTRTASILFDYYDLVEKGYSKEPGTSVKEVYDCDENDDEDKPRSVLSYFQSGGTKKDNDEVYTPSPSPSVTVNNKGNLLEKFQQSISSDGPISYAPPLHNANSATPGSYFCSFCNCKRDFMIQTQDGYRYCSVCNSMDYILIDHEKPSYKDPPKEVSYFAYKRVNHFNEWLAQIQGRETTDIPDDVYDSILLEIKKQQIKNMATLNRKKLKDILKKLRINKYYEHIPHIINQLNGMPSPHLSPELEDRLRHMFCQIQVPFLKHAPPNRKNFLSYSYCLNKMMQLLEKDEYLDSFPLLKSREKLHQQDTIWKKICEEVGWHFIPSL